jgi:ribosomal biogenesis protein LAS1
MADGVQVIWTPWRHHGELVDVQERLFPPSPSNEKEGSKMRREACDQVIYCTITTLRCVLTMHLQISAWKLRGNLPHAVESTWLLTEALLTDEIQANLIPIFAVKAAYITAISRYA